MIPWRRTWQPTPVFLPGEFRWTEDPGGLQSMGSQRVRHNWARTSEGMPLRIPTRMEGGRIWFWVSLYERVQGAPGGIASSLSAKLWFLNFPTSPGHVTDSALWHYKVVGVGLPEFGSHRRAWILLPDGRLPKYQSALRAERQQKSSLPFVHAYAACQEKKRYLKVTFSTPLHSVSFLACWASVSCGWILCTSHFTASAKVKTELCLGFSMHVCSVMFNSLWPRGL